MIVPKLALAIRQDDLTSPQVLELLRLHLERMHEQSPPGNVFALDVAGLRLPEVTLWTAWAGDTVAGMGALKDLGDGVGEIKSMRTSPAFLRRGVAAALLEHIIDSARARGMSRLSLETGTGEAFAPAIALYRRYGFVSGAAFAQYPTSGFSRFFHLALT
ncbi:MAG: GNAT family N-acetyltransferase [Pseudomonadales bacterium]